MQTIVIQLCMAATGSIGFALLFGVRSRWLLPGAIGAVLAWGIYLIGNLAGGGVFVPCLVASAAAALYSEILARILRVPATILFIPASIPLIPGGNLYETMRCVVQGDWSAAVDNGLVTAQFALAIAVGMSLIWTLSTMLSGFRKYVKHRKNNGHE